MAIKNFVSNDFLSTFVDSVYVFDCLLSGVNKRTALYYGKMGISNSVACVFFCMGNSWLKTSRVCNNIQCEKNSKLKHNK